MTKKVACAKVVPHYWHRSTANKPKKKAKPATQTVTYPPGFFTELVRAHRWPPRFEPQYRSDKPGPTTHARGTGYDRHPLGLPGAAQYTARWEGKGPSA